MKKLIYRLLPVSAALLSCLSFVSCAQDVLDNGRDTSKVVSEPDVVKMELAPLTFADGTRTSVDLDEETGLVFSWSPDDAVGVYSSEGGLTRFTIAGEAGASSALFDGQGFKLVPGSTYTAIYPYDGDRTSPGSIDMDYSGKTLNPAEAAEKDHYKISPRRCSFSRGLAFYRTDIQFPLLRTLLMQYLVIISHIPSCLSLFVHQL